MKPKKILFIYGGYSIHAKKRMKIFLEDSRFEIAVISRYDYSLLGIKCFKISDYRDNNINDSKSKLRRGVIYAGQLLNHLFFIRRVIKIYKPEVIFLQTLLYPAFLTFPFEKKIPRIITFWNGDVTWWAKWDVIEKIFKYQIVKRAIRSAHIITVNSNFAKECCKKYYPKDDKIKVLPYPGVDTKIFKIKKNKEAILKKYDLINNHIFFCPRGLASYLNNDQILLALYHLKNEINFTAIFLIGNATKEELSIFKTMVVEYELNSYIKIMKSLTPSEMSDIYSISDLTLSISSNDSQPNCMLESLACGTIVLMGDIIQIREWIIDCQTGLLCEIGNVKELINKIKFGITNRALMDEIRLNGTKLISERADLEKSKKLIKDIVINV